MHPSKFDQAFRQIRKPLWDYAVSLTRSSRAAAVLVRETESRASFEFARRDVPLNFKAWVFATLRNVHLARYRRVASAPPRVSRVEGHGPAPLRPRLPVTAREEGTFSHVDLRRHLDELAPMYTRPFTMYYTGYSYDEIARHLDLPVATVQDRVLWTRQQLLSSIRQHGGTYA